MLLLRIRISPALGFGHALETHRTSFEFVNMVSPKSVLEKSSDQGSFFFARLRGRTTKKGPRRNLFAASLGRRTVDINLNLPTLGRPISADFDLAWTVRNLDSNLNLRFKI